MLHCNINIAMHKIASGRRRGLRPAHQRRFSCLAGGAAALAACWAMSLRLLGERLHLRLHVVGVELHHVLGALRLQELLRELQGCRDIALGNSSTTLRCSSTALALRRRRLALEGRNRTLGRGHQVVESLLRLLERSARRTAAFPAEQRSLIAGSAILASFPSHSDVNHATHDGPPARPAVKVRVIRPVRKPWPAWTLQVAGIMTVSIKFNDRIIGLRGQGVDE